ncbi:MAG: hypothetical protein J7513_14610 [Solirubrobacteraceae bacterium]|nr:hypothetical protein [Solirubrobacteraceae bacterium]
MGALRLAARRSALLTALVVASSPGAPAAAAAPKKVPLHGDATVTSVDGPGRLTLGTKAGPVKLRLYLVDTPEPGECGAEESTAALRSLTAGPRKRVRYVAWSRTPDAEGRLPAIVGPRKADLLERSLGISLVEREWARSGGSRTISEADGISISVGADSFSPRAPRGVWARCGGFMHLPSSEPVPAHDPATWAVNGNGITESVGPIGLSATLAPGTALTVADVARLARVESTDLGEGRCWVRVPTLELVLFASTAAGVPCERSHISAIASSGPGSASTTNGFRTGQPAKSAVSFFPRLAASLDGPLELQDQLPLAGYARMPWAWQTIAGVDKRAGTIYGFATSTTRWDT